MEYMVVWQHVISSPWRSVCCAQSVYTGLFEMIVGFLTTCHLVLQIQPNVISFYGVNVKDQVYVPLPAKYPGTEGTNQNRH